MRSGREQSGRSRRLLLGLAAVVVLVVIAIAAAQQGRPPFIPPRWLDGVQQDRVVATVTPPAQPSGTPAPLPANQSHTTAVRWVMTVLLAAIAAGLLWILVRALRNAWADRAMRRRPGSELAAGASIGVHVASEEPDAPMVRRGIEGALQELDTVTDVSDAIVAAWLGLEQTAADSGLARGAAETPGEFVIRIIAHHEDARTNARSLLRLYEDVRFGGQRAGENDRARARQALQQIQQVWS